MGLHGEGIGGAVFLVLYTINLSILLFGFTTRRISFKSVYSFLLLHVVLRLAAQSVAIAMGSRDRSQGLSIGLLIAFFVLAAEGYFSLVLCAYRFLIHHHQHAYPTDGSWLEGKPNKDRKGNDDPLWKRFRRAMTARNSSGGKDPWVMTIFHWVLIGANVIIIVGGTQVNASDYGEADYWSQMNTAKIMRAVGQAIFLIINLLLALFLYLSVKQDRNSSGTLSRGWTHFFRVKPDHGAVDALNRMPSTQINSTLLVLIIAWPALIIRGTFGLLQALVDPINYANPEAYSSLTGLSNLFVVMENVFAVLPEWTACCLLCSTMFTKEGNRKLHQTGEDKRRLNSDAGTMVEAGDNAKANQEA